MSLTPIPEIWTLILAVLAIRLGLIVHAHAARLEAWNIPPAITGGLVIATVIALVRGLFGVELVFASDIRSVLLLVFFVGIGLTAKFAALLRGGIGVAVVCLAIVAAIVSQNLIGVTVARLFGLDPALGLFMGSIAFLGGHGTAAAWSQTAGVTGALEVGMACATLGLLAGGLVAGPVSSWLAQRHFASVGESPSTVAEPPEHMPHATTADLLSSDRWLIVVLIVAISLGLGELLRQWAAQQGWVVPGFLAAMAVAIAITNGADLLRRPVDLIVADLTGTVALRLFLAISMMGLKLWELTDLLLPLLVAVAVQIVAATAIAVLIVFILLGRGYTGAVASGGFIGFSLGAMPVGLGVMKRVTATHGPAPRAFLVITLAAALFADTANAVLVNLGLAWLD